MINSNMPPQLRMLHPFLAAFKIKVNIAAF